MEKVRSVFFRFLGGLFMEEKATDKDGNPVWVTSLGRIAFWAVFIHMMVLFGTSKPLTEQELSVFYALLGYQGVKLGGNALYDVAEVWKTSQPTSQAAIVPPAAGPKD